MSQHGPGQNVKELEEGLTFQPRFDGDGLIPAIVSDAASGQVLMFAYMNAEALQASVQTGLAHFWSRSRGKLWKKGEDSGNLLHIKEILTDCDQDVIWVQVETGGSGGTCHTGRRSCFYRRVRLETGGSPALELSFTDETRLFDPEAVYGKVEKK